MALLKTKDQEEIRRRLTEMAGPVKMIFFKENLGCQTCEPGEQLVRELAGLSDKLSLEVYNRLTDEGKSALYGINKVPALILEGPAGARVRFFGLPAGYEFAALLEGLKDVASGEPALWVSTREKLARLTKPAHIQVFVTPTCPFCPAAVRTAHKMAIADKHVFADAVEAEEFPELSAKYGVSSVPKIVINDKIEFVGAISEGAFADAVLRAVA